jgi:uroporphyrin-III C-methyltransferase
VTRAGKVYLIGAGPGDPDLLTLRAVRALRRSDLVLIDHLVNPEVLAHARPGVEIRSVGKRSGRHSLPQTEINRLLVEAARAGRVVARLKGGDPFVFGRGGEEAEALVAAGIAWEVVPGISAGIAAAAYAGIPVLHRERASSVAFVSGHPGCDPAKLALEADTLVVFMCGSTIARIARALLARGRSRSMPVALVCSGTTARQVVFTGVLGELARLEHEAYNSASASRLPHLPTPVIAVIGEVAVLAAKLHWFGPPPLPLRAAPRLPSPVRPGGAAGRIGFG